MAAESCGACASDYTRIALNVGLPSACALWRRPPVVRLLLIALMAEIGYAVLNISTMPVYLKYDRDYGEGLIALVVTAFLLSEALFKGPMGHLADRFGHRRLITLGPALTVFTSLLTLIVPHNAGYFETLALIGLRMLDGLGAAMLWPAAFALMNDTVADGERQEAMSLLNTCYLLGIALALPLGGLFNDLLGPYLAAFSGARTPSLFFASSLFLTVSIIAFHYLPSGDKIRQRVRASAAADKRVPGLLTETADGEMKFLLEGARRIPGYLVLGAVTFIGIGFPMVVIKLFAKEQFNLSETAFGVMALPGALAMGVLSVPMARAGERLGNNRAVHVGLGLCAAGLALISAGAVVPGLRMGWIMALGGIPVGLGFLLTIPAWYTSVAEVDAARRASNIGAIMTAQGLGAIIGAPLGGLLYQHVANWSMLSRLDLPVRETIGRYSPLLACAVFVTLGWLLSLRILRGSNAQPRRAADEPS